MPLFVRTGLRYNRWLETEGRAPHDFPADTISDLATKGDQLSVFEITDAITAERIAIAVAAGKSSPDHTAYSVFEGAELQRVGITTEKTLGGTADEEVNGTHYNLHIGSTGRLLDLCAIIANGRLVPILKEKGIELLKRGFESGQLDYRRNIVLTDKVKAQISGREGSD